MFICQFFVSITIVINIYSDESTVFNKVVDRLID